MIKMNKTIFVVVALFLIASLVLCGCKKAEEPEIPSEGAEETEVDGDISELEDLDEDLDMGDLEDIEKELEGIDW